MIHFIEIPSAFLVVFYCVSPVSLSYRSGCWGTGLLPFTSSTTGFGSIPKVVGRITSSGAWSVAATFIDTATIFRSVQASTTEPGAAGSTIFPFLSTGVRNITAGVINQTSTALTSSGTFRGSTLFNGALYGIYAGSTGIVQVG